ncbi:growth hormone releasing hormone receptor, like isoform X2 [Polypterus senegalus]|uniref:growth hormone releasing hormone receptor, like isoform X2 n=1 Tax=Polypterus senegalus TaxID=55291 RepID=UPI001962C8AB|nr:growth hormone releasing hormone receptor, like isoform X2 [Polypterus senegalus]
MHGRVEKNGVTNLKILGSPHPECDYLTQFEREKRKCEKQSLEYGNLTKQGCNQTWDTIVCWPEANTGETVSISCPSYLSHLLKSQGIIYRNCTVNGWSNPYPPYYVACVAKNDIADEEGSYFATMKTIYSIGYGTSIVSLTIAVAILLTFRRLHCARNYIHVQLFITFILKSVSVFIKDAILFASEDTDHCSFSTVACKVSMVFCNYCVMTNFFWLLVEALYLNSLLLSSFHQDRKFFWWFVLLGWGFPKFFIVVWIISRLYFEDTDCWDINETSEYWWIIKGPIVTSIAVNFILFLNIIRILIQKLDPRLIQFNNSFQYRRLAKSTLLLIPLFGTHYMVFNFLPQHVSESARLFMELCLGSFQGFLVAVLYCFLNQEVQSEIQRKWIGWQVNSYGIVPVVAKDSQADTPF